MKHFKILLLVQTAVLLGLSAVVVVLICHTVQTHEAIRLVCRYLAGG